MALLELLSMDSLPVRYNIPHLPIRLKTFDMTAPETISPHWHEELEILYVLDGMVQIQTKQYDRELHKGDGFVVCTRQIHSITCPLGKHARLFILHADLHPLIDNHTLTVSLLYPMFQDPAKSGYLLLSSEETHTEILRLLEQICEFETTRPTAYALELAGLLSILIARICRTFLPFRENRIPPEDIVCLQSMVDYISRFYAEKIQLADISSAGHTSRSKCCKIFKTYLNLAPIEFLNSYRLSISRELLITTPWKISAITTACGFSHQSYFSRIFREKYGLTPNEYRIQNILDSPNF